MLVAATLVVAPLAGLGLLYVSVAAVLGALFVAGAVRLYRGHETRHAVALFRYSIAYLFILFLVMTADTVLRMHGA